jgi:hypothetical protein
MTNVQKIADKIMKLADYSGQTTFNFGHSHNYVTNEYGNGETNNVKDHIHIVNEFKVRPAGDGHRHLIKFEEAKNEPNETPS